MINQSFFNESYNSLFFNVKLGFLLYIPTTKWIVFLSLSIYIFNSFIHPIHSDMNPFTVRIGLMASSNISS